MSLPRRLSTSALQKPVASVLSHCFQEPVANLAIGLLYDHQALVAEGRQQIEYFPFLRTIAGADLLAASNVHPPANTDRRCKRRLS